MDEEKRLTPELLERLKSITAFELEAVFMYVPKAYREKDENGNYIFDKSQWALFKLKSKDGLEVAEAEDSAGVFTLGKGGKSEYESRTGSMRIATLEKGIIEIRNLPTEDNRFLCCIPATKTLTIGGKVMSFRGMRDVIRRIKPALQVELQNAINERSMLTEEEEEGLQF